MKSDDKLFAEFMDGDSRAYAELYDLHKRALFAYAQMLTRDRATAEDIVQEVFVRLLEKPQHYRIGGSLKGYLYASVRNRVIDLVRRQDNWERKTNIYQIELETSQPDVDQQDITAGEIARAIAELPEEQAEVVTLHIYSGMTFAEIGGLQNCNENTAVSRYRYALAKLAKVLGGGREHHER